MNPHNGNRYPRCHRAGIIVPDSIVRHHCLSADAPPVIPTATAIVILAMAGGER